MDDALKRLLTDRAEQYNDPVYFQQDPIAFPTEYATAYKAGTAVKYGAAPCRLQDVEIAAVFAAHLAWGRREMIVRDCGRLFEEMDHRPYDYVMEGDWRDENVSLHRTIKWSEVAAICSRLKAFYGQCRSLEALSAEEFRTVVYGQKPDAKAPNKKINMLRRWMVRRDGKVDLGVWTQSSPASLIIPLDVHVYGQAVELGLTSRKPKDLTTAKEITAAFDEIFPRDPCKGDFALFGYGVTHLKGNE